jgi:hypothetical protein
VAENMVIIKSDGKPTTAPPSNRAPMLQAQAKNYLANVAPNNVTNLSQALNQAFDGNGNATGAYLFNNQPVLHASAGKKGKSSLTLFYYMNGETIMLFAMGEHQDTDNASYELSFYGQPAPSPYCLGAKITL